MTMTLIGTGNVTTATNTLTISSVPSTYQHLWFMISGRTTRSAGSNAGYAEISVNGSITPSYYRGFVAETPTANNSWTSASASPIVFGTLGTVSGSNTGFSQHEVFFDYYNSGYNRTAWSIGGNSIADLNTLSSDGAIKVWRAAGYDNTTTPTSFTITEPNGNNFSVGSVFSLYGIS